MKNKTWIAFANRKRCHHAEAFKELGYISWTMHRTHFNIGDIIYFFMSDERCIRFKGNVVKQNCNREDSSYWIEQAPNDKTYRIQLIEEYHGTELQEKHLFTHGFKGYLRHPLCNNEELLSYITSKF